MLCAGAAPARALMYPGVERPTHEELKQQRDEGYLRAAEQEAIENAREFVGGLALNLDYRYGVQDLVGTVPMYQFPFAGRTKLETYSVRPEFVFTNWLSTYGIVGLHRGENTSDVQTLDLDGWMAGVGVNAAVGLDEITPECLDDVTLDPLFVLPDFNWTHNEFDGIDNDVNAYNLTIRIGGAMRTNYVHWGVYGGPQYQASTRELTVQYMSMPLVVDAEPKDAWSGVIGSFLGVTFKQDERRPDLLLSVEGGVGNRQGALVSLRYEYDVFR